MIRSMLEKRMESFRCAFAGWRQVIESQPNARIHAAATLLVVGLSGWLGLPRGDWAVLILAIGLVWTAEMLNTAIEYSVDLASPGRNPLAGASKDVAAGAVLAASACAVVIGTLILGPPLWEKLKAFYFWFY
jgi:diacylglycerol kinase